MALDFNYDRIVREHDEALDALRNRIEQAGQVKTHADQAAAAADGMAAQQATLAAAAAHLIDMMGAAQFDASSLAGCVDASDIFGRAEAHEVEEHAAALAAKATEVGDLTASAADAVQTSQNHITGTYGHLAAGVQETGVRGEALEAVGA